MHGKYFSFCLIIVLGLSTHSFGNSIDFDYLRIENGLPHATINDFIQDSLGYIWFATDDGLAYYNNYKISVFRNNINDSASLTDNEVYKLFIDSKNKFWVGTKQSLDLYDQKKSVFRHFHFINDPKNEKVPIIEIFQKNDSILLLGTDGGGLRQFNTHDKSQKFFLPEKYREQSNSRVSSIYSDKYGRYWIGTLDNGVFIYAPESFHSDTSNLKHILKGLEIRKIIELNEHSLLVACYGRGVKKVNIETLSSSNFELTKNNSDKASRFFDIIKKDKTLYIGSDGEGLFRCNLNNLKVNIIKNYGRNSNSISNNVIRTIFIDQEKNLWLGHYQGGISLLKYNSNFKNLKFTPYSDFSLSHPIGSAILKDSNDQLWIGTDGGGLNIISKGKIYNSIYNNLQKKIIGDQPQNILSLFEDSNMNIWIGSYLEGIYIYRPKTKKLSPLNSIYPKLQLSNKDIRCITQDRQQRIWIGTNGGGINIIDLKSGELEQIMRNEENPESSVSLNWIRCIYEDSFGYIWIGTSYGLNVYDPINKTFRQYFSNSNDTNSISSNVIYSVTEDRKNQIWIGTSSGLNKYNRKSDDFKVYKEKHGLPGNIINSIMPGKENNLWISTNNGISNYNSKKNTFSNYNTTDGIVSNFFINGAGYNSKDSCYFFGSTSGVTYFNPYKTKKIDYDIPVVLSDLKIFNQSISVGQLFKNRQILKKNIAYTNSIELLKRENVITIDFTALSYSYSDKIEYEYRLLGFTNRWNIASKQPSVTYTNLKSGHYTFQVRVRNLGNHQPIRNLEIIILPPIHETWWFQISISLIFVFIILVFIRLRLKNIKNQRDILEQKYEIEKLAVAKERADFDTKINDTEKRFRQDEISYKNSQLISTTMLLTLKNKKMNQVKNKISTLSKMSQNPEQKKNFKEIVDTINSEFKVEKDWGRFEAHFNDVHKDFIKRLKEKQPELSLTYLRLCAYLKLDLSTKEIATLMNISQRGVEKSRSRLRKKLAIGADENLHQFISKI